MNAVRNISPTVNIPEFGIVEDGYYTTTTAGQWVTPDDVGSLPALAQLAYAATVLQNVGMSALAPLLNWTAYFTNVNPISSGDGAVAAGLAYQAFIDSAKGETHEGPRSSGLSSPSRRLAHPRPRKRNWAPPKSRSVRSSPVSGTTLTTSLRKRSRASTDHLRPRTRSWTRPTTDPAPPIPSLRQPAIPVKDAVSKVGRDLTKAGNDLKKAADGVRHGQDGADAQEGGVQGVDVRRLAADSERARPCGLAARRRESGSGLRLLYVNGFHSRGTRERTVDQGWRAVVGNAYPPSRIEPYFASAWRFRRGFNTGSRDQRSGSPRVEEPASK